MQRTDVMPVEPFCDLFVSWPDNSSLDIKQLRLKVITLLALSLFLRPSDIAPKSVNYNNGSKQRILFSRDLVTFDDSSATITLFGIKNDMARQGFRVKLPRHPTDKLCPVSALQSYMDRTHHLLGSDNAVFLSLTKPHTAVSAQVVGKVLEQAIKLAGLPSTFTAKYFRPTGATLAIDSGQDPEIVRKIGRWKSSHVFYEHYVHSRVPPSFTTSVLPQS